MLNKSNIYLKLTHYNIITEEYNLGNCMCAAATNGCGDGNEAGVVCTGKIL